MKIFENSNTAKMKYPEQFKVALDAKIPERYILAACKFLKETNIHIGTLRYIIMLWHRYVYLKDKSKDINKIKNFREFNNIVLQESQKYQILNQIFNDYKVVIGILENVSDIRRKDVKNIWCIKSEESFRKYQQQYNLYLIDNGELTQESLFVLAISKKDGKKIYWDLSDVKYENEKCIKVEESLDENAINFINQILVAMGEKGLTDTYANYQKN